MSQTTLPVQLSKLHRKNMCRIRDGPILRSVEGVDSLHVDLRINFYDLERFCTEQKIKWEKGEKSKWQRKGKIFLAGGPVTVTYHLSTKNCTFEFGGFCNYSIDLHEHKKLQLLRMLIQYFPNRSWSVSRLDYAVDINIPWDMFLPDMRCDTLAFEGSTIYFNTFTSGKQRKKLSTLTVYDKAAQIKLFSTPLTRVELRLFRSELNRLKLRKMFDLEEVLMKTSDLIYSTMEHRLKLHSVDGEFIYRIATNTAKTLQDFLEFLHGDMPTIHRPDPFRIHYGLELSNRILSWMKSEDIKPGEVKKHVKGKKVAVCKSLGIDNKTFDKAIDFLNNLNDGNKLFDNSHMRVSSFKGTH